MKKIIIISVLTAGYLIISASSLVKIINDSSILKSSDIERLDNVQLLSRAYYISSKNGKNSGISFQDASLKEFIIHGAVWNSIVDKTAIYDTLQYSNTKLSLYVSKEGFVKYKDQSDQSQIEVLGLEIGNVKLFDLDLINSISRDHNSLTLILSSLIYFIVIIAIRRYSN